MTNSEAANKPTATAAKPPPIASAPAVPAPNPSVLVRKGFAATIALWIQDEGPWWLCSFVFHMILICSLALIGTSAVVAIVGDAPSFEEAKVEDSKQTPKEFDRYDIGETPEEPTELSPDTLLLEKPGDMTQEEKYYDDSPEFTEKGGGVAAASDQPPLVGLGADLRGLGPGPGLRGGGGVGVGQGEGTHPGSGSDGMGLKFRGSGYRKAMLGNGGTRQSERAVAGALNWLARHQMADGSWSLDHYMTRCKDSSCAGPSTSHSDVAGTALGLLPFLAAGQTHENRGPYKQTVNAGIFYLSGKQRADGSFAGTATMYEHGMAAIALCECFGMTGDKRVQRAAQGALDFIAAAQDPSGGGWRYEPRTPGDTSVTGWQVMALKSGQMAGLNVSTGVLEKAKKFLDSVAAWGDAAAGYGGHFGYTERNNAADKTSPVTLSAVGLLCYQYLGVRRTDPTMIEGTSLLMQNLPAAGETPGIYYWYYATQVMHNQPGADWDAWNRKMRRLLIDTQCKDTSTCANGSWDPRHDHWGTRGGRLMQTSLSALTLEVYYRYLPLYTLDRETVTPTPTEKPAAEKPAAEKPEKEKGKEKEQEKEEK